MENSVWVLKGNDRNHKRTTSLVPALIPSYHLTMTMFNALSFDGKNVTQFEASTTQEHFPNNINDIIGSMDYAVKNKCSLYPVSTGYNWGLGSKLPTDKSSIILNLSKMDRIIDYDGENGFIVIEPGVTQQQIADYLEENNSKYYVDVTGSSKDTSVVGNCLERGIAYNMPRVENLVALELITGDAKLIQTGNWRFENSKTKYTYKYGVGPDLTGLFVQANFGIVSKAVIKLLPKLKYNYLVQLSFRDLTSFSNSLESFDKLREESVIKSIFHVANQSRAKGALINHFIKTLSPFYKNPEEYSERLINNLFNGEWVSSGLISGSSKEEIRFKKKRLKKILSKYCEVKIISSTTISRAEKISQWLKSSRIFAALLATKDFRLLFLGAPTDAALGSVLSYEDFNESGKIADKVDSSGKGFMYCLPITDAKKSTCLNMIDIIEVACGKFGFNPSITLNPIMPSVLEAVVSIEFEREQSSEAHECIAFLEKSLIENGHIPYRTNIKSMDLYFSKGPYLETLKSIKHSLDPNNIISPGRYLPEY